MLALPLQMWASKMFSDTMSGVKRTDRPGQRHGHRRGGHRSRICRALSTASPVPGAVALRAARLVRVSGARPGCTGPLESRRWGHAVQL